jgi:hypothetical protein
VIRVLEMAVAIVLAVLILTNLKGLLALVAMGIAALLVVAFAALDPESRLRIVPFALVAVFLFGLLLRRRLRQRNPRAAAVVDGGGVGMVLGLVVAVVAALLLVRVMGDDPNAELVAGIVAGTVAFTGTAAGAWTGYWLFDRRIRASDETRAEGRDAG